MKMEWLRGVMNGQENGKQLPLVAVCGNKKDEEEQEKA